MYVSLLFSVISSENDIAKMFIKNLNCVIIQLECVSFTNNVCYK